MQIFLLNFVDLAVFVINGIVVVAIIASWLPNLQRYSFVQTILGLATVILTPARRLIPPKGQLDWSPLVTIIALQVLQVAVHRFI